MCVSFRKTDGLTNVGGGESDRHVVYVFGGAWCVWRRLAYFSFDVILEDAAGATALQV